MKIFERALIRIFQIIIIYRAFLMIFYKIAKFQIKYYIIAYPQEK